MLNRDPVNALESIFCVECMRVDGLCSFARRRLLLSSKRKEYFYASWYFFYYYADDDFLLFFFFSFLFFVEEEEEKSKAKAKGEIVWGRRILYLLFSLDAIPRIDLTDLSLSLSFGTKRGGKEEEEEEEEEERDDDAGR